MGQDRRSWTRHGQHGTQGEARCPFGGPGQDSGASLAGRERVGETATIRRSTSSQPHHRQRWPPLERAYRMDPDRPDPRLSSLPKETLTLLRAPTLGEVSLPQHRSPLHGGRSPSPLRPAPLAGGSPRSLRPHSPDGRARPWKDGNRSGTILGQPRLEGEVLGRSGKPRLEGEDRRPFVPPGTESGESMEDREPVGERVTSRRWRDSQDHLTRGLPPRPLPAKIQATLETPRKMPCSDTGHHTSGYVNVNPAPPSSSLVCRPIPPPSFSRQRLK
ncbi:uncharacterized protein LOC125351360 [Perognathus longimembris pacificus]|uniref:uncharacterized protein LOC125351360 n=1 Tax=Perognathus longimembris pacificus TaxID=214514 RepID=UPI002018AC7A|nr:uncharacterized protein LOC125351360 [Perognathus longimembris pacificus]